MRMLLLFYATPPQIVIKECVAHFYAAPTLLPLRRKMSSLRFRFVFDLNLRFSGDFERPVLHVRLDGRFAESSTDERLKEARAPMVDLSSCENLPKTVLLGLRATWLFAASPIKRSVSVNAT